ncbi:MAG: response regulator [Spirochaetales bacterium]|nr:response regulator [Spirochaetales bacterium]
MERSVLVVDDSVVARMGMKKILKGFPLAVVEASSGEDALASLEAGLDPSLVFLDLTMPGMGGLNALRELRRRKPDLPVVVVTADIQKATIQEALEAGATEVLPKPAEGGAVLGALARAGLA